jgi:hypothetical protein
MLLPTIGPYGTQEDPIIPSLFLREIFNFFKDGEMITVQNKETKGNGNWR